FVGAVAAGRGVPESMVRDGFGQGRLLGAREALAAGMIDEVATTDEVIADLAMRTGARASVGKIQSAKATRSPLVAASRQEPAYDDWLRTVSLSLRLLDL